MKYIKLAILALVFSGCTFTTDNIYQPQLQKQTPVTQNNVNNTNNVKTNNTYKTRYWYSNCCGVGYIDNECYCNHRGIYYLEDGF